MQCASSSRACVVVKQQLCYYAESSRLALSNLLSQFYRFVNQSKDDRVDSRRPFTITRLHLFTSPRSCDSDGLFKELFITDVGSVKIYVCIRIYIRIVFPTGISICFIYSVVHVVRVEENIHYAMLLGSEAHEEDVPDAPEDIRND